MELRPEWIALIGAVVGAFAATVAPILAGLISTRHDRAIKKHEEKLRRFEEIYECLATLEADIELRYWPAAHSLLSESPAPKEPPPELARLDMLVALYAPELRTNYREAINSVSQLYGEYVEWVWIAHNGAVGERDEDLGAHCNHWMMASVRVQDLKNELAKVAQEYEL